MARRSLKALVEAKSSPQARIEAKKAQRDSDRKRKKKKKKKHRRDSREEKRRAAKRRESERLTSRARELKHRLSAGVDALVVRGRSPVVRLEAEKPPTEF